jgi:hypothetical protein
MTTLRPNLGLGVAASGLLFATALAACSSGPTVPSPTTTPTLDANVLRTCREAFAAWVDGSATLNTPGTDIVELLVTMERVERRVLELCTLAEAEALNLELQIEDAPGFRRSLIEPDMRTFAEVECVDESPLLDGTALCQEVLD